MTGPPLVLLEPDDPGPAWAPFAGARPIAELRAGAFRVWERWQRYLDPSSVSVLSRHTPGFADVDSLPLHPDGPITGPAVVARSNFLPVGDPLANRPTGPGLADGAQTIAWIVAQGEVWAGPKELADPVEIRAMKLNATVDLLTATERLLEDDCARLADDPGDGVPPACVVLGDPSRVITHRAVVEPQVVFDVRKGPIVLEEDTVVRAGTRLEGPLWVGRDTWLVGGVIRHSVIGPHCRVHGEVAASVFLGYANKSHDGFLGHSVVGQWVNLGAGTITSNLKNTYGEVRLDLPDGRLATGRTNVGTLFGDHAKMAIGSLLATGTVIGTGANVVGAPVPRYVAPFRWGDDPAARLDVDRFVTVAGRVMPRRGVEVTPEIEASLRATWARLAR